MTEQELLKKEFELDAQVKTCRTTIEKGKQANEKKFYAAEAELSLLEDQLKDVQQKRLGWRIFTRAEKRSGKQYHTPGLELDARAKEYALKHKTDYTSALNKIMEDDPILCNAYLENN